MQCASHTQAEQPAQAETYVHRSHPGLAYTQAYGLHLFQCEPYRARLTSKACAARYREANDARGREAERIVHCRSCPIGASHAGVDQTYFSQYYDTLLCPRCHKTWLRIIKGRVCVSCYNRERELVRGYNAKGIFPAGVRGVWPHTITVAVDGKSLRLSAIAHNAIELALHCMRTTKGRLTFGFTPPEVVNQQGALL